MKIPPWLVTLLIALGAIILAFAVAPDIMSEGIKILWEHLRN